MLKEVLTGSTIILVITQKNNYRNCLKIIYEELSSLSTKLGYVTINKPYSSIASDIKARNINPEKVSFVDAITATVESPPVVKNCIFVSSPTALTDLGLAFSSLYNEHGCEIVIFDTISTLIVYQDIIAVTKFVHNLVTKARVLGRKLVMICVKEDSESLIKNLNMFVDKIVEDK